jgi:hypothetical protein
MDNAQDFANNLFVLMEETFEAKNHGIYLDKGTSLFETLETVSAEEASIPVGGKCASLAAQVAHVTFYIESFERYALRGDNSPRDWGYIWRTKGHAGRMGGLQAQTERDLPAHGQALPRKPDLE